MATKAPSQPHHSTKNGTMSGVISAPMLVPELKMPVAKARSLRGNHSATVLIDAGKLPASPRPSRKRASAKPAAAPPSVTNETPVFSSRLRVGNCSQGTESAKAWPTAATLHSTMAIVKPFFVPSLSITRPARSRPMA